MCTGTLVGRRTVLTAAHCLTASSYSFELGSRTVAATKAIGHPDFVHLKATLPELPNAGNDWDMNDVAVLILASPVSEVTPIAPPTGSG
jgi:V8-like Glu-specific endopeptidase